MGKIEFSYLSCVSVTPDDYQPPGFVGAEKDTFEFDEEPVNIKVGDVETVRLALYYASFTPTRACVEIHACVLLGAAPNFPACVDRKVQIRARPCWCV